MVELKSPSIFFRINTEVNILTIFISLFCFNAILQLNTHLESFKGSESIASFKGILLSQVSSKDSRGLTWSVQFLPVYRSAYVSFHSNIFNHWAAGRKEKYYNKAVEIPL